jgi:hypothetical protein
MTIHDDLLHLLERLTEGLHQLTWTDPAGDTWTVDHAANHQTDAIRRLILEHEHHVHHRAAYHRRMQHFRAEQAELLGVETIMDYDGPTTPDLVRAREADMIAAHTRHMSAVGAAWEGALRLAADLEARKVAVHLPTTRDGAPFHLADLQEAPDTEPDIAPPHGIPRPCACPCHTHGDPHTWTGPGCCPNPVRPKRPR